MLTDEPGFFKYRRGRLTLNDQVFAKSRIDVEIPKRDSGKLALDVEFTFGDKRFPVTGGGSFEYESIKDGAPGPIRERIRLGGVELSLVTHANFNGGKRQSCLGKGRADSLEVCRHFDNDPIEENAVVKIVLTSNSVLEQLVPVQFKLFFPMEERRNKRPSVHVPPIGRIFFDRHYDSAVDESGRVLTTNYYLVARFSKAIGVLDAASEVGTLIPRIDDLVLICSYATRVHTACVGWLVEQGRSRGEYYRRDKWIPEGKLRRPKRGLHGLVPIQLMPRFLRQATAIAVKSPMRTEIRLAIQSLNNSVNETIEKRFLSLFSAVEGLLETLTKKLAERVKVSDQKKNAPLRKSLGKVLTWNLVEGEIDCDTHDRFSKRINEFGGMSFVKKVKILNNRYHLQDDDLWPLIGPNSQVTLYKIRNVLAHGRGFEQIKIAPLMAACRHIECMLERMLCTIFKWPLQDTDIDVGSLSEYWHEETVDWRSREREMR